MKPKHTKGREGAIIPVEFATTNDRYRGTFWKSTTEKLTYQVIEYHNKYDVEVRCLEIGNVMHVYLSCLRCGAIKNPFFRGKYGGYFGEGPYTKHGNLKAYSIWSKVLYRLAPENQLNPRNASYQGTSIYEPWYNFQVFADWFENYISLLNPKYYSKYQIDKDILTYGTNIKLYSPDTCCLVPDIVNLALDNKDRTRIVEADLPIGVHRNSSTGNSYSINISLGGESPYLGTFNTPMEAFNKYKELKENYLKQIANYYYSEGAILKNVHDALYSIDIKPYRDK